MRNSDKNNNFAIYEKTRFGKISNVCKTTTAKIRLGTLTKATTTSTAIKQVSNHKNLNEHIF